MAKILYEKSSHPKIKAGELSIAYLTDCEIDGAIVDAIVLFKSENKQTMMQYNPTKDGFSLQKTDVISLSKIEKGCLILNVEEKSGYRVAIVDKMSKRQNTKYWKDEFLHVRYCKTAHNQTNDLINSCCSFIKEKCVGVKKTDKAFVLSQAKKILSESNEVVLEDFAKNVFSNKSNADGFLSYVTAQNSNEVALEKLDLIRIEPRVAKRKSSFSSTTLHLDSNFDIKIYGGKEFLVQGFDDEAGLNYYTLYYKKEK